MSLAFSVPLLASVASETADVSWLTTVLSAESLSRHSRISFSGSPPPPPPPPPSHFPPRPAPPRAKPEPLLHRSPAHLGKQQGLPPRPPPSQPRGSPTLPQERPPFP